MCTRAEQVADGRLCMAFVTNYYIGTPQMPNSLSILRLGQKPGPSGSRPVELPLAPVRHARFGCHGAKDWKGKGSKRANQWRQFSAGGTVCSIFGPIRYVTQNHDHRACSTWKK